MRLSYSSLFPEQVKHAWCKRKRLADKNAYDLPAGDYCIYDLYPLSGVSEPDIFFTVESRKNQSQQATLKCLLYGDKAEVSLSAEHLQSVEAPQLCQMVSDLIASDAALRKMLNKRKQEVQMACQTISSTQNKPETYLLSETTIRKLAGTLEQAMVMSDPEYQESVLDQLLIDLKKAMLSAFEKERTEKV